MNLVLVDSYDSFTHNLAQAFQVLGADVVVVRSDEVAVADLVALRPDLVVLGPGPGAPAEAGCLVDAARTLPAVVPVLGVCLGHQALGLAFGGRVGRHPAVHGLTTPIEHDGTGLFAGVRPDARMTRYHSLVVDPGHLPACLAVTATAPDGAIMGLRHRWLPAWGVQFHPESVDSGKAGLRVLANALALAAAVRPRAGAPAAEGEAARPAAPEGSRPSMTPEAGKSA